MFSPEKISPDSLLEGEYMLDGMFVFFISSLSLHRLFPPPFPLPPLRFLWWFCFSPRLTVWSPSPIYISVPPSDFFSSVFFSFLFFRSLCRFLFTTGASAPCPVAEGSRLGPSSVSDKVALQLAACPIRDPSLPGRVTPSSALPLPRPQHRALAALSQLEDQHWKVNSSEE